MDDLPATELEWLVLGAEAEWHARNAISQNLPALATEALVAGWDSPALRVLAGQPADSFPLDLGDLLAEALRELGRPEPSIGEAVLALVRFFSWQIVTERLEPIDGARHIERLVYLCDERREPADFMSCVDEWEGGWGASREDVERTICALARGVLGLD